MTQNADYGAPVPYDPWLARAGLIEPEMVDVPDGYYTHEIVLGQVPPAQILSGDVTPVQIPHEYRRLEQPRQRFRKDFIWRWNGADSSGAADARS